MRKHELCKQTLLATDTGTMQAFGNSMLPVLQSGVTLTYARQEAYKSGDIVFCKVRGRYIDAHYITKIEGGRYMIANKAGKENGWADAVFGRVVKAMYQGKESTF